MEHLFSAYLIQHKICTLPQVGTLRIIPGSARLLTADKMMSGPAPVIEFDRETEQPSEGLVAFIAGEKGISSEEASRDLSAFCSSVQQLFGSMEVVLPGTGKFFADAEGMLHFSQDALPESFLPPVPAIRVVHPGTAHSMRVGDSEVSSSRMQEIISDSSGRRRLSWWLAALFVLVLSAGIISYYFFFSEPAGQFGNIQKVAPANEPVLYRKP